jgi:hypothetical protein
VWHNVGFVTIDRHAQAMLEVRGLYFQWRFERLRFIVEEGAKCWWIVQWEDRAGMRDHSASAL